MRRLSLFVSLFSCIALLSACGGGGGDTHTSSQTEKTVTQPQPSTASNGISTMRARALAANDTTPASGTSEQLPVTSAGEFNIDKTAIYVGLHKTPGGKYYGFSDQNGTYLLDPSQVSMVCANSFQVGWQLGGNVSRACAALDANGYAPLPRTCNKDAVIITLITTDGRVLYADNESERAFLRTGIPSVYQNGFIVYGDYKPMTISAKKNGNGVDLTVNFQSNCLGGFGKNDKLTDLDPSVPLKFLWHSDKAGANGGPGWGLNSWQTSAGDTVPPSTREAYLTHDDVNERFSVTFTGLPCADAGNLSVYKGTGPSNNVVWDPQNDDGKGPFGAGWLAIQQNPNEVPQLWSIDSTQPSDVSLSFDREKYQITWSAASCS